MIICLAWVEQSQELQHGGLEVEVIRCSGEDSRDLLPITALALFSSGGLGFYMVGDIVETSMHNTKVSQAVFAKSKLGACLEAALPSGKVHDDNKSAAFFVQNPQCSHS